MKKEFQDYKKFFQSIKKRSKKFFFKLIQIIKKLKRPDHKYPSNFSQSSFYL